MDHAQAPVLEALSAYHRRGPLSFTPPGHKQGAGADPRAVEVLGDGVFASDILAMNGLDDRRMGHGVLEHAQRLMADAVHAEHTFFSTCGSSLSVKSAMLAVAGPHEKLLVSRNAHKSVIAGLIIAGIEPVWVSPRWDAGHHFSHPPGPEQVAAALDRAPDARGMLLVSPTAYGTCADVRAIADLCHRAGKALVVDEAWGAHLPFHPDLPTWAMDAGADVCVTSVHKMGAGLEQGSVFHLQGDLVGPHTLKLCEDLLGTTSPSVLVYAGLDGWRRQMVEHGRSLLGNALDLAGRLREEIARLPGLCALSCELVGPGLAFGHDPLIVVIDVSELGTSGYAVSDWLFDERAIAVGLADHRRVVVQITHADTEQSTGTLLDALAELSTLRGTLPPPAAVALPSPAGLELETAMLPRTAFFGPVEQIPVERSPGRVAAEMASPYPPGVPAVCPGERISQEVADYLRTGAEAGMYVPDCTDPSLRTLRVVAE
ncbi:aminotransferase class I/II-fold pyridoxal phosphate-dependent enzyme [Streptomyces morookaense]|uniref:Ornithine decarboxylase n=1 Tax=Streptomyces morookaense TaxID=1970 RepID=A0A7Y7AZY6_STRMO|nr:ornithine decarboxylase [Streptomyces morookaense]NVK76491.1 ornithine decarboxylase [Streptomyces morookaense]GHF07499.1 ornithine decarboxylase [Streptomyces morookaense]